MDGKKDVRRHRREDQKRQAGLTVPVQLEDDGAVHDGEAQQANPPQQDAAEHAGMEVQDDHLHTHTGRILISDSDHEKQR